MKYSVVVPVYNEEANIAPLYRAIKAVIEGLHEPYEILFVNDGSTDRTLAELTALKKKEKNLKILDFRVNFGQSAAMRAGFDHARGEIIITMDGDLQNDPKDIPRLLAGLQEYDVVSGWRADRKDNFMKRLPSLFSNWLHRRLTGVKIHDSGCSLKVYKRETVEDLPLYGELHRYIPALIAQKGYTIGEMKVTHHPRKAGKTKYGTKRLLKGFLDLLDLEFWASFSARPLHFFGGLGGMFGGAGIVLGIVLFILRVLRIKYLASSVLPLLSIGMFLVGVQFLILGLLANIMIRVYYANRREKPYSIKKIL